MLLAAGLGVLFALLTIVVLKMSSRAWRIAFDSFLFVAGLLVNGLDAALMLIFSPLKGQRLIEHGSQIGEDRPKVVIIGASFSGLYVQRQVCAYCALDPNAVTLKGTSSGFRILSTSMSH